VRYDWDALIHGIPNYDPTVQSDGYHFDEDKAAHILDFCAEMLTCWKGPLAGEPFRLLEWQAPVVANLFGWVDDAGLRRYREAFIYISKKSGKSPLVAAIMDYMLLCDGEDAPEVFCAACDVEQANIAFNHAWNMIKDNEELMSFCREMISRREIQYPVMNGKIKVLSSDVAAKDGLDASCIVIDEVHRHDSPDLINTLMGATSARQQPLTLLITTADYDRQSICNDKLKYARGVIESAKSDDWKANGTPDAQFLPVVYEMGPKDDWTDPENWKKSNPALGTIKSMEYMERACLKAQNEPAYRATFRRLECNQMTQAANAWIDLREWDECNRPWTPEEVKGCPCWFGVDLASVADLAARAMLWYIRETDEMCVDTFCWIPEDGAQKHIKDDKVPYDVWRDMGLMAWTPGNRTDYNFVRKDIVDSFGSVNGKDIAMDPHNATHLINQLTDEDGLPVIEYRQGWISMSPPCKELERRIGLGKIRHNGNPLLRWMIGNAMIKKNPQQNYILDKDKSSHRIDGVTAAVMAIGRASLETNKKSVYETRGALTL
jgi:phage terminase large subunit-like protein